MRHLAAWTGTGVLKRYVFYGTGSQKKVFCLHVYSVFLLAHENHMLLLKKALKCSKMSRKPAPLQG